MSQPTQERIDTLVDAFESHVMGVSWSPDGTRIVSSSNDRTLKVWAPDSSQEKLTLEGHTYGVSCVAWSPDGQRILSGDTGGNIKLWDAEAGTD